MTPGIHLTYSEALSRAAIRKAASEPVKPHRAPNGTFAKPNRADDPILKAAGLANHFQH